MTAVWRLGNKKLEKFWETSRLNWSVALNRQVLVEWNYEQRTEWVNFTIWWALADAFDKIVTKWDIIEINWSLQKSFKENEDGSKTEFVNFKVSNFNLLGRSAIYFNDRNSVDVSWNVTYIWDDKELDNWNVIKSFSIAVDNSYKNREWEDVVSTNYWNLRMTIPKGLKETFKEKLQVGRWINASGSLLFWENNGKKGSTIKVPFETFYGCYLKKAEAEEQRNSKANENEEATSKPVKETYANKEERIKDEMIEEEVSGMPFTEEQSEKQVVPKAEAKAPAKKSIEVDAWDAIPEKPKAKKTVEITDDDIDLG